MARGIATPAGSNHFGLAPRIGISDLFEAWPRIHKFFIILFSPRKATVQLFAGRSRGQTCFATYGEFLRTRIAISTVLTRSKIISIFLTSLHPTLALSDFIHDFKISSSMWIKDKEIFPDFANCQEGYGAF